MISTHPHALADPMFDQTSKSPLSASQIIDNVITTAIEQRASDIHFEPYESVYRIRIRIDGVLVLFATPSLALCNTIAARLKVLADLDIAIRRTPQDGRFSFHINKSRSLDIRVSTLPTQHGEKIVLRLLHTPNSLLQMTELGMTQTQQITLAKHLNAAHGMIVVTGPTGCGKTVSLYTALRTLNSESLNILSVEDPIEIQLPGINQVQVNSKSGMTLATTLRAFLRQDPDVILVGEIRDSETASIAIKAAQTGHLVLSTLHTNSAPDALVRLANMGVPAYQIASAVQLVIAQRLVRRLCEHCKKPSSTPDYIKQQIGFSSSTILYEANQCTRCHNGYIGRIGLFELLPISTGIVQCVLHNNTLSALREQANQDGVIELRESGLELIKLGHTSLEEVQRVIGEIA